MDTNLYHKYLEDDTNLRKEHTSDLASIISTYPYFQSARVLYLKALKNADSFRYNHELKVTAAHTNDRAVLFDFITSDEFSKAKNVVLESKKVKSVEQEAISIGKPLQFTKNEKHSFNEWLQISTTTPVIRKETSHKKNIQEKIIDKFIASNPKIIPVKKEKEKEVIIPKELTDNSLMTETLAKVYLEQKKFKKAIKAYEILSLKYPEKSSFFADQIKRIEILKQKKS